MIDTHAHLDAVGNDLDALLERSWNAGVEAVITVGTGLASSRRAVEIAEAHPKIYAAVGIHPHDADDVDADTLDAIAQLAKSPKVVAIGEIGLDFIKKYSAEKNQRRVFADQLALATQLGLPTILHTRGAEAAVLDMLLAGPKNLPCQIHCYTGSAENARAYLDLGCLISFTGVVTYPDAAGVRAALAAVPIERQMLETDLPYMAPVPMRGRRNEPAFLRHLADAIAVEKGLSTEDVIRITSRNAREFFNFTKTIDRAKLAYQIRDSLYINLTSRCPNECEFCPRSGNWVVKGHYLRLERDPSAEEILDAIGDPSAYREICFCGYGEPTERLEVLKRVARAMKDKGKTVRVNTNGQGELVNDRDILPELFGLVDSFSVSLNTADPTQYAAISNSRYGARAFDAVKNFIRGAVALGFDVTATAVDYDKVDIPATKKLAHELGAKFRARKYKDLG